MSTKFRDSFRFLTKNGFEHILSIEAETYPELLSQIAEIEADVLHTSGVPLMSVSLRPTFDLQGGTEQAPAAPAEQPAKTAASRNEPVYEDLLEPGQHKFPVKEVFHDQNQNQDKDFLKVVIDGDYEYSNGNWGIAMFKGADKYFPGWMKWQKGKRYQPPANCAYVIVEDPKSGKFANIIGFVAE